MSILLVVCIALGAVAGWFESYLLVLLGFAVQFAESLKLYFDAQAYVCPIKIPPAN